MKTPFLCVLIAVLFVVPIYTEEIAEEVGDMILSGDIAGLEAYVAEHGDFTDKTVPSGSFGDVGIEFVLAYLPFAGFDSSDEDAHLFVDDPQQLEAIRARNEKVARFVFENGGDPNMVVDAGFAELTYLGFMFAALGDYAERDPEAAGRAALLVDSLADVFYDYGARFMTDATSVMTLFVEALLDDEALLEKTIAAGADPTAQIEGMTAGGAYLSTSTQRGTVNPNIVRRLLGSRETIAPLVNESAPSGMTYLGAAVVLGLEETVQLLLDAGQDVAGVHFPSQEWGIAHLAAASGRPDLLEALVSRGAPVGAIVEGGATALHVVADQEAERTVEILLAAGADLEAVDGYDLTPYQGAVLDERPGVAEALEGAGARTELPLAVLQDMLQEALDDGAGAAELEALLAQAGESSSDLLATDLGGGRTPLHRAVLGSASPEAVGVLLSYGADPFAPDDTGRTPFHAAAADPDLTESTVWMVMREGAPTYQDERGRTVLHLLASLRPEIVRVAIDSGIPIDALDGESMTALSYAARSGEPGADAAVSALIGAGADIATVDNYGWTPIMHAVRYGRYEAFQALREAGADIRAEDFNGLSVFAHAAAGRNVRIVSDLAEEDIDIDLMGPIVQAAYFGASQVVEHLIDLGADTEAEVPVYAGEGDRYDLLGFFTAREAAEAAGYPEIVELLDRHSEATER